MLEGEISQIYMLIISYKNEAFLYKESVGPNVCTRQLTLSVAIILKFKKKGKLLSVFLSKLSHNLSKCWPNLCQICRIGNSGKKEKR